MHRHTWRARRRLLERAGVSGRQHIHPARSEREHARDRRVIGHPPSINARPSQAPGGKTTGIAGVARTASSAGPCEKAAAPPVSLRRRRRETRSASAQPAVRGVLGDQTAQARSQHDVIARSEEAEHAVDRTKLTHQPAPGAAPDLGQLVSCPNSLGNATRSARERMHVGVSCRDVLTPKMRGSTQTPAQYHVEPARVTTQRGAKAQEKRRAKHLLRIRRHHVSQHPQSSHPERSIRRYGARSAGHARIPPTRRSPSCASASRPHRSIWSPGRALAAATRIAFAKLFALDDLDSRFARAHPTCHRRFTHPRLRLCAGDGQSSPTDLRRGPHRRKRRPMRRCKDCQPKSKASGHEFYIDQPLSTRA